MSGETRPPSRGLLDLPPELSDQIYSYALPRTPIFLQVRDIAVAVTPLPTPLEEGQQEKRLPRGLSEWVLANKQICSDVANLISREGWFRPAGLVNTTEKKHREEHLRYEWKDTTPTFNSVIFCAQGVRNIVTPPHRFRNFDPRRSVREGPRYDAAVEFFTLLQYLRVRDPCLFISWGKVRISWPPPYHFGKDGSSEHDDLNILYDDRFSKRYKWWHGRFRKVSIDIDRGQTSPRLGNTPAIRKRAALACATRLVGDRGVVSWEVGNSTSNSVRVVVERRVETRTGADSPSVSGEDSSVDYREGDEASGWPSTDEAMDWGDNLPENEPWSW